MKQHSKIVAILLAARPKFLVATASPVIVGSVLGYAAAGTFSPVLFILALLAIMSLNCGVNMVNDYFDHTSGNDWLNQNVTPFSGGSRFIQEGILVAGTVLFAGIGFLAIGSAIGIVIVLLTRSIFILVLGLIGLFGGYFYTAAPLRLGYRLIGELIIGLLCGVLPVYGSYYLQTGTIESIALLPGCLISMLVFLVILANEFLDVSADTAVNKKTLVVRFGLSGGVWIYRFVIVLSFVIAAAMLINRTMFFAGLLYLFTLPIAFIAVKAVNKKNLVRPNRFRGSQITILLYVAGSAALTVGFIIQVITDCTVTVPLSC